MKFEITGDASAAQMVTLGGQRFVIVPEREYQRLRTLADGEGPALPARDKHGNYPAAEALGVSIARSIIRSRRERGLAQAELARRAGIRPETLNRIEQGKHNPSVATLERLEKAFHTEKSPPVRRSRRRKQTTKKNLTERRKGR